MYIFLFFHLQNAYIVVTYYPWEKISAISGHRPRTQAFKGRKMRVSKNLPKFDPIWDEIWFRKMVSTKQFDVSQTN